MRIDLLAYRIALALCLLALAVACYCNYQIQHDVQKFVKEQLVANQKLNAAQWKLKLGISGYWCYQTGVGITGSNPILDGSNVAIAPRATQEKK